MRTSWYTKRIIVSCVVMIVLFPLSHQFSVATLLYSIQILGPMSAVYYLLADKSGSGLGKTTRALLCASLLSLSFGDLFFYVLLYIGLGTGLPEIHTITTVPYVACYIFAILGLLSAFQRPLRDSFRGPVFWTFPIVVMAFTIPYLFRPLITGPRESWSLLTRFAVGIDSVFVVCLVSICFYVLLSTRSASWSILALGFFSLGLTDWNATVENLNIEIAGISFNTCTWTLSGFLISLPFWAPRKDFEVIQGFRQSSLLGPFRLLMFLASVIPLWFILVYSRSSLTSAVIISMALMWAALAVVLISQSFLDRLKDVGQLVSRLDRETPESLANVPEEFREEILAAVQLKEEQSKALTEARVVASENAARIAKQVAHDIRSPLAALSMVEKDIGAKLDESLRIILRESVSRINDIANDVMTKNVNSSAAHVSDATEKRESRSFLLSSLINEVVTEKRIEYRDVSGIKIDFRPGDSGYGLFAHVEGPVLKRVLSNLINNSVQAIGKVGAVTVHLDAVTEGSSTSARIEVRDNGPGIPEDVLPRLGTLGVSHGKTDGAGMGLFHAHESVAQWGGRIAIRSTFGSGTTVQITLPPTASERWLLQKLTIAPDQKILVVDDDSAIHGAWQKVLDVAGREGNLEHFQSADTVLKEKEINGRDFSGHLCLIDYEFINSALTGLDLIDKLDVQKNSVLVTSRFDDPVVQKRATAMGVRILPKSLAHSVPIRIASAT